MAVKKKKRPGNPKVRVSKKKAGKHWSSVEFLCVGVDVSMSSVTLGGVALTKGGKVRAGAVCHRWSKDTDFFQRMKEAAKAHDLMHDLQAVLKVMAELDEISIAVEEAVPIGMLQRSSKGQKGGAAGAWMKQQIQISGAFIGGLLRWGYQDIYEIQAKQWQAMVAEDLGITTHHTKWNSRDFLDLSEHMHTKNIGKYRAQQWMEQFHPKWDKHWPDIISSSKGQISRPETSKALGIQSADEYEGLAMAEWLRKEIRK